MLVSLPATRRLKLRQQFERLLDLSPFFIWNTDVNEAIVYLSCNAPAFLLRWPTLVISAWRHLIHGDDILRVEHVYRRATKEHREYHVEYRVLKVDGSVRWMSTTGVPRFSTQGNFLGYGGTIADLTNHRSPLASTVNSEETYQLLNENSADLISQHAPNSGVYLYASASFKPILGFEPSELVGTVSVYELIHPEDEKIVRDEILRQLNTARDSETIEFRVRHKEGHYIWMGTNVKLLTDPATGRKTGAVAISRDISLEHAARDELRKREERFRHLTTISSDWYWETDELDRFTFLPHGVQRPSHKPPEALIGKTRRELATDPSQPALRECFEKVAKREPFKNIIYATKGPNEQDIRYVNISGAPVFENDIFKGYRGVGRDVTEEIENAKTLTRLADENKAIIENSPDIMAVVDRDGRYLHVSRAASDVLGYEPEQLLGLHFSKLIHTEDNVAVFEAFSIAHRCGEPVREFESRWLHRDGYVIHMSMAARWSNDTEVMYLTARDVTERYRARAELQKSRDQISSILERIGDAYFSVDRQWCITYANRKAAQSVDLAPGTAIGKVLWETIPDQKKWSTRPYYEHSMQTGEPTFFEIYSTAVGEWLEIRTYPHEDGLTVSFRDITDRHNAEVALRASEQRLRDIIQLTPAGYILAGENADILDVNSALCQLAGYTRDELVGKNLGTLFSWCPWPGASAAQDGPVSTDAMEAVVSHRDGHGVPVLFSGRIDRDAEGNAKSFTAFLNDITKRKQAELRMEHLATHDTLTGLPNRAYLNAHVEQMLEDAPPDRDFAVMFIDLDRFKEVNDSFGHDHGDSLLREVSHRMQSNLGPEDVIVRLGGDEFVVVAWCPDGQKSASAIAAQLLSVLTEPVFIAGQEIYVTASVGISMRSEDGKTKELLFQNADTAMYRAKAAKRNCYRFFEPNMSIEVKTRMTLSSALHHALDRKEFELHYQPRFDLKTMSVCAMEALLRWNHPRFGRVMPMDFIPIAEETGLIEQIGHWALEEACMQTAKLIRESRKPLRISVNLSPRQLQRKSIVEDVRAALEKSDLPPHLLELELTESALVEDIEYSTALLKGLKKLGIQLAVDDFGTGYSGLSYLRRFPLDILKLDRSFVIQQDEGISNLEFIKAFVDMAHALKLSVVGEGIETSAILKMLADSNCDEGQGYFFAKPMPFLNLERFLSSTATKQPREE